MSADRYDHRHNRPDRPATPRAIARRSPAGPGWRPWMRNPASRFGPRSAVESSPPSMAPGAPPSRRDRSRTAGIRRSAGPRPPSDFPSPQRSRPVFTVDPRQEPGPDSGPPIHASAPRVRRFSSFPSPWHTGMATRARNDGGTADDRSGWPLVDARRRSSAARLPVTNLFATHLDEHHAVDRRRGEAKVHPEGCEGASRKVQIRARRRLCNDAVTPIPRTAQRAPCQRLVN